MARAVLVLGVFFALPARAQFIYSERDGLGEQFLGLQARGGGEALIGEGSDKVDQPLAHTSASLQFRVLPDWYLELTAYGERTLSAKPPEGKTHLGTEGAAAGVRFRGLRPGKNSRLVLGAGVGGARVFQQGKGFPGKGHNYGGAMGYGMAGLEREVYGDQFSAAYVGVEGVAEGFFVDGKSPFNGAAAVVRITMSYYMGGTECSECL